MSYSIDHDVLGKIEESINLYNGFASRGLIKFEVMDITSLHSLLDMLVEEFQERLERINHELLVKIKYAKLDLKRHMEVNKNIFSEYKEEKTARSSLFEKVGYFESVLAETDELLKIKTA